MALDELLYHHIPTWVVRRRIRNCLRRMNFGKTPVGRAVQTIFEKVLSANLADTERRWIDRIEGLRAELKTSQRKIAITDYGAGHALLGNVALRRQEYAVRTAAIADIVRYSKPPLHASLLFHMVRHVRLHSCLELGTCLGLSAAYIASALRLNGAGKLITLEGADSLATLAGAHFARLGVHDKIEVVTGPFRKHLPGVLQRMPALDFVFIDGHHDGQATLDYLRQITPHLADRAFLIFDDISWSLGMRRAWRQIQRHAGMVLAVDLRMMGMCVYERSGG